MKAQAPLQCDSVTALSLHGGTANSNGDENTHASSFKKVTILRVIDEKESKSRLKESNSGSTIKRGLDYQFRLWI